ncbi:hypothetical protein [Pseudomonas flexibilis]|uniref:hypothetical protein n=1 Tax=Pseudomonas flexibilis TaxID=706570 RepID=UPI0008775383|nr:hypothetical protein [Pseudomonas flexibilis]SCY15096.1 hypothetical protein SAMN02927929_01664 [Pseudomonas flexibilis]
MFISVKRLFWIAVAFASLVAALWQFHLMLNNPTVSFYSERAIESLQKEIERELAKRATPEELNTRILQALDPTPADWLIIDEIEDYAGEKGIDLSPDVILQIKERKAKERGLLAGSKQCWSCITSPNQCPLSAAKLCDVAVEITPIGDVRTLVSEDADQIDIALATVGLVATGVAVFTGGSTAGVKAGASLAKAARKAGSITRPMTKHLTQLADNMVDVAKISDGTWKNPRVLTEAVDMKKLNALQDWVSDLTKMRSSLGTVITMKILHHADTPAELRALSRASEAVKKRMLVALDVIGKSRLIKLTMQLSDAALTLIGAILTGVFALIGLFWNAVFSVLKVAILKATGSLAVRSAAKLKPAAITTSEACQ